MELTKELRDLLNAHNMASVTDFVNSDYDNDYLEETDLNIEEIDRLCEKYDGWGLDSLEEHIVSSLKDFL